MTRRGAHTSNRGGSGRGDRKGGAGRPPPSREVTVSRNLSYLLRHNAENEGIKLDEGGWANVAEVLLWRKLASMQVTLAELKVIVDTNDKQRYQLKHNPNILPSADTLGADPSHFLIRASQGHSIATVTTEQLLTPVLATDPDCPNLVVHGTYANDWELIKKSGGLKSMKRNHIHFATGEFKKLKPIGVETEVWKSTHLRNDKDKLLSGMRQGASTMIWVDVKKSLEGGVKWWRSENNVFLTEGLEKVVIVGDDKKEQREKILGFEWFRWVEKRGDEKEILWKAEGADPEREKVENELRNTSLEKESRVGRDGVAKVDGEKTDDGSGVQIVEAVEPNVPVKENWDD